MNSNSRLNEILAVVSKDLLVQRNVEAIRRLTHLLKVMPKFNDLESLRYVDGTGVLCKTKGEEEKVFVAEPTGDTFELVKEIINKFDKEKNNE